MATAKAQTAKAPAAKAPAAKAQAAKAQAAKGQAAKGQAAKVAAAHLPVAQVAVDMPLPHLDRPFDYLVPDKLDGDAVPGVRVRVRFAGRLTGGYLLRRVEQSEHAGTLAFLERVVSPEPVLTGEIAGLARAVADRYGGTLADVLRLAIPPRHAAAESPDPAGKARKKKKQGAPPEGGEDEQNTGPEDEDGQPGDGVPDGQPGDGVPDGQPGDGAPDGQPGEGVPDGQPGDGVPAGQQAAPAAEGPPGAGNGAEAGPPAEDPEKDPATLASPRPRPHETGPGPAVAADVGTPGAPRWPDPGPWDRYPAGRSFLRALAAGRAPRAAWSALPGPHWPDEIARAAATTLAAGRGTLIVVPDAKDLDLVDAALAGVLGPGRHVSLAASLGPAERYRRWLAVERGQVRVAAGTRSAMFAPVAGLGLVVIWDDGDDLHEEPRAPYPHAREVLALRAHRSHAAALMGGFARTAEMTQLVESGWAAALAASRDTVRRWAPRIAPTGEDAELARDEAARSARMPGLALRTAREALTRGPVLFQVPRRGYLVAVACERCGTRARCARCGGPLALPAPQAPAQCGWCGVTAPARCRHCGQPGLRALVVGAGRTAEELGRAFPATPVKTSGGTGVLAGVSGEPAVVVATPGAEPRADGGYAAAILLDSWALLGRASLRASEETLRRWLNAAALVRPGPDGGSVVVVADASLTPVQALLRWDPVTHAERELAERRELRFPPAVRIASLTGPQDAVEDVLKLAQLPAHVDVLGPVPAADGDRGPGLGEAAEPAADGPPGTVRMLVRAGRRGGTQLALALRGAQAIRSARKDTEVVRLQLDPAELL